MEGPPTGAVYTRRVRLAGLVRLSEMIDMPIRFLGQYRRGKRRLTLLPCASKVKLVLPVAEFQIGQLWKNEKAGEVFLVTRVYAEALATMAVLRKSGAENEALIRVKVDRVPGGQNLPGYLPAQGD